MNIVDAKGFGEAIRQRRKELHYTQSFVAEVSGFSVSFISDLERGKSTAELGKAIYLANLLGLDCVLRARGKE
jgi:transcriptional regulator with XRE-family HTH domain